MNHFLDMYWCVYKKKSLPSLEKSKSIWKQEGKRPYSVAVTGGAFGDEGKGRITDDVTAEFLKKHEHVVHYRDNGGANAGHTIMIGNTRLALHQLGAGVTQKGCTVILGKDMVLHPKDLVSEIAEVLKVLKKKTLPAKLMIDEMTALSLDTHRAFEGILKKRMTGGSGSTGRGIGPAYADILYRHPVRVRDLVGKKWKDILSSHFDLYSDWIKGMGGSIARLEVAQLAGGPIAVGAKEEFIARLGKSRTVVAQYATSINDYLQKAWDSTTPIVFEKAQGMGLDRRWGIYPDITASDCSFDGILSSTEGIVDPRLIAVKAATIKATYSSSVGSRVLPTQMGENQAHRIREDAYEYGATTKRPRDIAYIDLPMLRFFRDVGNIEYLALTHADISYADTPIKVCVGYKLGKKEVSYKPDQEYLNRVTPQYIELPSWDGASVTGATKFEDLPREAQQYITFLHLALGVKPLMITVGAKRHEAIRYF